jgi:hypothetical protein
VRRSSSRSRCYFRRRINSVVCHHSFEIDDSNGGQSNVAGIYKSKWSPTPLDGAGSNIQRLSGVVICGVPLSNAFMS